MRPIALLAVAIAPALAAQATPPQPQWDVTKSLGFDRTLDFRTSEGTWMSVDVSADGRWVAFDLLGDIYRVPIAGGTAERLTSGPAWDQIPRWSPKGGTIAFVSDRDGADNIWLMDGDGKNPRAATKEKETLPTNPAWSPDGDYVVVKRHVTDQRSLGGGEIWLYHVLGGKGATLVQRQGFTSEKNEPAFSPDGRYVYFVQAGPFDYNRNVHAGIFQVVRYDRQKGAQEPVTTEEGGAVRPTPSPDGKQLAFVRRIGTKTALVLRDLEEGRERVLTDSLDHDQMETWTLHGAYPAFDWTPDSKRIVIAYRGKIHSLDVATSRATDIPFTAHVQLPITKTVHFPQQLDTGATFRARVIRWPTISPDGRTLVFQAVGRIWQIALPAAPVAGRRSQVAGAAPQVAGRPERVTDADRLEFAPAISPDGRWVAFTTWGDSIGGAVWKVPLRPGRRAAATRLTTHADQYANPAWSPDGRRIAFVEGSERVNRGADLSDETQIRIRWVSADGGPVHDVTTTANRGPNRRMPRISWSPDGQRILYQATRTDTTVLVSVRLDGTDERLLAKNDVADEMVASPDGRYIAFKELHNMYVAPLPMVSAQPVLITSKTSPTPVKQLSRWGGDWIAWTAHGTAVSWSLGPTIYRQTLDSIFVEERREGASPDTAQKADSAARARQDTSAAARLKPNPVVTGDQWEVMLTVPRRVPRGVVALTGARLVTMKGDEVIDNGTIVVEGDRIRAVGPAGQVQVPAGARTIDVTGKTIIPGLIDVHAHMGYIALDINPERPWQYYANLAYGVTTTHDPSASTHMVFSNKELVEAGDVVGPRILSTGFVLYGARNPERAFVNTLEDARGHLRRIKSLGGFSVKSYNQLRRDARQWIIQAAREEQMHVYPEGGSTLAMNGSMMVDGHTGIEHAIPVAELYTDWITLASKSGTGYTPTLIVGYGGVWGENYWYQKDDVYKNSRLLRFTPRGAVDARARRRMLVPEDEFYHVELSKTAKRILDAGGQIQLGAHGQLQGLGAHWELWMLQQGGMTQLEALRSATLAGARYLGLESQFGSLEAGKMADLVVLDANPLEAIRNSEKVGMVMKGGVLFDENLNEVWPVGRRRGGLRF